MNQVKLEALIEHITNGGALDPESVAAATALSPNSTKTLEKYLAEASNQIDDLDDVLVLKGTNPFSDEETDEDEEDEEEEEPQADSESDPTPKKEKAKKDKPLPYKFFLQGEGGASTELEVVNKGKKVITFREVQPTDIVPLIIGGREVEVDLIPLRRKEPNEESEFPGITNALLLQMAVAARA